MPTDTHAECTKAHLAPNSSESVWECIVKVIEHVYGLENNFIATVRGDAAVVFCRHAEGKNLITVWPKKETLAINLRASGPESQSRIDGARVFSPEEFDSAFATMRVAMNQVFVRG